jgi:hypothetical protein
MQSRHIICLWSAYRFSTVGFPVATTIENQCCCASLVFTCSVDDLLCTVFFILQGRALLNAIGNCLLML